MDKRRKYKKISLDDHLGEEPLQIYPAMVPLVLYYYKAAVIHD